MTEYKVTYVVIQTFESLVEAETPDKAADKFKGEWTHPFEPPGSSRLVRMLVHVCNVESDGSDDLLGKFKR